MNNRTRAFRRHQRIRRINKNRHIVKYSWGYVKDIEKQAREFHTCSCSQCGNPRRHHNEVTLQERKAQERYEIDRKHDNCQKQQSNNENTKTQTEVTN